MTSRGDERLPGVAADAEATRYRSVFLPLWIAMVALQSGLLIHDVGAAWLISQSTQSHSLVALAQTAASLPFFLFALPAGALSDMVDRRRIAQAAAFGLSILSLAVAGATASGFATIPLLLAASFLNGCANAAFTPSWQALTPELVAGERLPGALALNSLGINIARALGPLLSGALLFVSGPVSAFLFNALLYLAVGFTFLAIAPRSGAPTRPSESLLDAICAGLAYARHDRGLQRVALRGAAFFFFASTFWALAPVVVRERFAGSSLMLGAMVGSVGIGAILAALMLKRLRQRFDLDAIMLGAGLLTAAALAMVPAAPVPAVLAALHVALGFGWLLGFSSIHLAAQLRLAPWIRARGSAIYLIAVFGSLALGSLTAGLLADRFGLTGAFLIPATALLVTSPIAYRIRIAIAAPLALSRSATLPAAEDASPAKGPIVVVLSYALSDGVKADAVSPLLRGMRAARLRSGATAWSCAQDGATLIERVGYPSSERMQLSAMRHTTNDVHVETALLALLRDKPVSVIRAAASFGGGACR
jgi:MFS family permease